MLIPVQLQSCSTAELDLGSYCHQTVTTLAHLANPSLSRDGSITHLCTGATAHRVYLKPPCSESRITKKLTPKLFNFGVRTD